MKRIFTFFFIIAPIAILYMSIVIKSFFPTISIIKLGFMMSAFLEFTFRSVMMPISNEVLVEITFLVALIIEIGMLFIFILVIDFMKAAGLLPLFVV